MAARDLFIEAIAAGQDVRFGLLQAHLLQHGLQARVTGQQVEVTTLSAGGHQIELQGVDMVYSDTASAFINIDFENVGKWATDNRIPYTNFKNLSQNQEVSRLVQAEVDRVNEQFARVENVRRFKLLTKELDHDDDELTATMKVRRSVIEEKFSGLIADLYR